MRCVTCSAWWLGRVVSSATATATRPVNRIKTETTNPRESNCVSRMKLPKRHPVFQSCLSVTQRALQLCQSFNIIRTDFYLELNEKESE